MDRSELEGVLAHELGHVKNRDILIASIAATVAIALTFLVRMAFWTGMGGNRRNSNPAMAVVGILAYILVPMAAMVIQASIGRSREYEADRTGAAMTGAPLSLARALEKLGEGTALVPMKVNEATAQLFIADPLKAFGGRGGGMGGLGRMFSTHPPIPDRVQRLTEMAHGGIER
jgi:heat shock protein HtpX